MYVTEPRSKYIRGLGLDFLQRMRVQGNRLQIFDKSLKPVNRLGHMHHMSGRDYRQFKDITRVWVASNGDIYLTDNGNHRIMVFNANLKKKKEIIKWEGYRLRYPNGVDGAKDGRIAIADTGHHNVLILTPDYKIEQILGGFGTSKGKFSKPREVRFGPGGNLYVLDTENCRIQVFKGHRSVEFPKCHFSDPLPILPPTKPAFSN